ncbi:uncharacterized protein LOC135146329 isoform X1 [Zophobas morio]|uniref:uncharacterized protein LOC135146329 isoform X1 n=1 Tax=Zophobas morio TaxID=2755281 RepID=UPI0030839048
MHFAANYGWYVLIGWIPKYFKSELHVSGENLLTTCLPYVFGVIGSYLAGYLSTASFIRKKIRLLWIRRFFAAISSFLPALFLIGLAVGTKSVVTGTALLCSSMFFARMAVVGYWANMIDVAPNNPEFVMGISNMVATIPGILGNNIVGVLMGKKNSWGIAFGITSGMYVVGGIIYLIFSGAEPLDREEASENKLKDDVYMESQMEFVEREEENNSEEKSQ